MTKNDNDKVKINNNSDGSKEQYVYEDGKLKFVTVFNHDGFLKRLCLLEYYENDSLKSVTEYYPDGPKKKQTLYDKDGKAKSFIDHNPDGSKRQSLYENYENGNLKSMTRYGPDGSLKVLEVT